MVNHHDSNHNNPYIAPIQYHMEWFIRHGSDGSNHYIVPKFDPSIVCYIVVTQCDLYIVVSLVVYCIVCIRVFPYIVVLYIAVLSVLISLIKVDNQDFLPYNSTINNKTLNANRSDI